MGEMHAGDTELCAVFEDRMKRCEAESSVLVVKQCACTQVGRMSQLPNSSREHKEQAAVVTLRRTFWSSVQREEERDRQ